MIARLARRAAPLLLAALAAAYLCSFADHARQLLGFAYPLDYGEGPLLAQVGALRAGTPIWRLYADPATPPHLIINYPPLYLLLCAALAPIAGSALLSGRLISLLSALACVAALAALAEHHNQRGQRISEEEPALPEPLPSNTSGYRLSAIGYRLLPLLFLSVPIVREWAALMRVDMLGVALGLWALAALRRWRRGPGWPLLAGALLVACLFCKPSLIAAPAAAAGWMLWELWWAPRGERGPPLRALLAMGGAAALGGGLLFGLLQWASGGWFALHVVAANANRWDGGLAGGFWAGQAALRWPLAAAALLAAGAATSRRPLPGPLVAALCYTLGGTITAAGVGKVGAYSNYFLELYAGLIWLVAAGWPPATAQRAQLGICLLLIGSLLYYPPLWDASRLRPAGLIEPSPPRLAFGRGGLWADARREAALLAALSRVDAALASAARADGPQIFTDMPGVAAAAPVGSRLQVFEARQLLDQGLAGQADLLAELANGAPPLAVIDYLGNWLTPEVITLLQRRYAQDGSLGTFDLYRPVDAGPLRPIAPPAAAGAGLLLSGYRLAAPLSSTYEPGELLTLSLEWRRAGQSPATAISVTLQLTAPEGGPPLSSELPLLYGAFPPASWPTGRDVEHVQTLALPADLPPGRYGLSVRLRAGGADVGPARSLGDIAVAPAGGRWFSQSAYFVPAPLMRAWAALGGIERAGLPLTPAVPFGWGRLQCFERACLELRGAAVSARPLGAQLYLAETSRSPACPAGLCAGFLALAERYGAASIGAPLSGEIERNGWLVQWTSLARLERRPEAAGLGRLGAESLRLSPGQRYRWP